MELPPLPTVFRSPVVESEGGIARRLHFGDEDPGTEGVDRAAGQVVTFPWGRGDPAKHPGQSAVSSPSGYVGRGDVVPETQVEMRVGVGIEHDPALRLEVCLRMSGHILRRGVNLDREVLGGVEPLHEQREVSIGCG